MTPLRKRMIEDMQLRNLAPETQRGYLHHITGLARFYQTSPEHLTLEDLRQYQVYLAQDCLYSADSLSSILRLGPLRSSNLAPLLIDILRHLGRRSKLRPAQIQPVKLIT